MRKGQMSLEMVIGLIILLIVAGVIITLFLKFLNPESLETITEQAKMDQEKFKMECESLCKQYHQSGKDLIASKYCEHHSNVDWDGHKDTKKFKTEATGSMKLEACDDSVYCFLVYNCESLDWEECRDVECTVYQATYGNTARANEAFKDNIVKGTCGLVKDLNWFTKMTGGNPNNPCGSGEDCSTTGDQDGDQNGWTASIADSCDSDCGIVSMTVYPSSNYEANETICSDGIDNDCDGATDVADSDCGGGSYSYWCDYNDYNSCGIPNVGIDETNADCCCTVDCGSITDGSTQCKWRQPNGVCGG